MHKHYLKKNIDENFPKFSIENWKREIDEDKNQVENVATKKEENKLPGKRKTLKIKNHQNQNKKTK